MCVRVCLLGLNCIHACEECGFMCALRTVCACTVTYAHQAHYSMTICFNTRSLTKGEKKSL